MEGWEGIENKKSRQGGNLKVKQRLKGVGLKFPRPGEVWGKAKDPVWRNSTEKGEA